MEKEVIFLVSLVALIGIIGFVSIDSNFDNSVIGNIVAEQSEMTRSYGYVEAPKYGTSYSSDKEVSTDRYKYYANDEIKQVFTPIVQPIKRPIIKPETNKPVINDLEDLKRIICLGYDQKPAQDKVGIIQHYDKYGRLITNPEDEIRKETTVTYNYDDKGKLNSVEPMGGRSRKFAADAG